MPVAAAQVLRGLPADHETGEAVAYGDDGGPGLGVVVAGHGVVVGPGGGDREEVAGGDVLRQGDVGDDHVPALAVAADDHGVHRLARGGTVGGPRGVTGEVEGGAQGVAHTAVDGDEPTAQPVLDGAYAVERHPGGADHRPAGLDGEPYRRAGQD